jgi:hypothetical protein
MGDIAQLALSYSNEMPKEILQLANYSPIGVVNTDQANWLLLVHRSIQPNWVVISSSQS